jgi:hypothetical protein
MRSAAIQATAIAGAWVLPATWTGRTEASTTRSPVTPRPRCCADDDVVEVRHHNPSFLFTEFPPRHQINHQLRPQVLPGCRQRRVPGDTAA